MMVAITGTHGTGKSTLSYLLAAHYKQLGKNVKVVQETARNCPFPLNDKMTIETCLWIYHEHSKKELEAKFRYEVVICDRSFCDSFVYMRHKDDRKVPLDLYAYAKTELKNRYDKVIICRPDIPLISDGIRSSDEEFQKDIDYMFSFEIGGVVDNYIEINSSQIFSEMQEWKSVCL